jgi:hypothetical protein
MLNFDEFEFRWIWIELCNKYFVFFVCFYAHNLPLVWTSFEVVAANKVSTLSLSFLLIFSHFVRIKALYITINKIFLLTKESSLGKIN